MPAWIHDRAEHIRKKNPSMPEGQAWAIATQQSHAAGKTPRGYGTPEGKKKAKQKYSGPPSSYKQTADPSSKTKSSGLDLALLKGFTSEVEKIAAPSSKRKRFMENPVEKPAATPDNLPPPLATVPGEN